MAVTSASVVQIERRYKKSKHRCICSSCELKKDSRACTEALLLRLGKESFDFYSDSDMKLTCLLTDNK